jgi:Fe-Mn family superoxide dismutase
MTTQDGIGPQMQFVLNELIADKQREAEYAASIRHSVPELEDVYVRLLQDWEQLFSETAAQGQRLLEDVMAHQGSQAETSLAKDITKLLEDARTQSGEFTRQLGLMQEHSAAVRNMSLPEQQLYWRAASDDGWSAPTRAEVAGDHVQSPQAAVPIGGHTLPPLPYPYHALEPWIDEKTMRIHHDIHHQSYVDGLNKAEKKLEEARKSGDFDLIKHWERELAFHGAGHYLHTLFWQVMSPVGGGKPTGALATEIDRSFGNFDAFRKQFSEAANKVEGGGWAILVWSPRSRRLEILTAEKHQNLSQWDVVPLLPLDVWEHAYYLKHQNNRAAYVNDWWNVVHWPYVAERYEKARMLQWTPY